MSDAWDLTAGSGSDKKKAEFANFPEGITRIRVIGNAPFMRWTHWWPTAKRSINCPGRECPICEIRHAQKANKQDYSHNMARRFSINVWNFETTRAEILEQGVGFFEQLKEMKEEAEKQGGVLQDYMLKVKRKGKTQADTNYRVDLLDADSAVVAEVKAKGEQVDHAEYFKPHTPEQILALLNGKPWEEVFSSQNTTTADDEEGQEEFVVE